MQLGAITFTILELFNISNIIVLIACVIFSLGYFVLKMKVTFKHRKFYFYFYLGMVLVTPFMIIPLHILSIRFIEIYQRGSYIYTSPLEQIHAIYRYRFVFEAEGFFLPDYVII